MNPTTRTERDEWMANVDPDCMADSDIVFVRRLITDVELAMGVLGDGVEGETLPDAAQRVANEADGYADEAEAQSARAEMAEAELKTMLTKGEWVVRERALKAEAEREHLRKRLVRAEECILRHCGADQLRAVQAAPC